MKYFISVAVAIMLALPLLGQNNAPEWLNNPPAPTADYYYRVSQGTGITEDEATKKAFGMAILESAFAVGVPVDIKKLEQLNGEDLLVEASHFVKIPINKVCQYTTELSTRRGYRVYILCQVANDARKVPKFKSFNCVTNKEEE